MREKIKLMLFGAFIFYVVLVVGLIIYTGSNHEDSFEIFESDSDLIRAQKLNSYKEKLATMENNTCTTFIKELIDYYEKTDFKGKVTYQDYYNQMVRANDENSVFFNFFEKAEKSCNLNEKQKEEYNFSYLVLAGSIQIDEIMKNYYYDYELNLEDKYFRDLSAVYFIKYQNNINRESILIIISNLIEIYEKGAFSYGK
ncbi:MAG: hypothetical protein ACI31R_00520 [Bacilli bacterium]